MKFETFQELTCRLAKAGLEDHDGIANPHVQEAQALIAANGLTDRVSIQKMHSGPHVVYRLSGPDGDEVSYIIGPTSVEFHN